MSADIQFREVLRDEVPQVVALLGDDMLGQGREAQDVAIYLDAYDRMMAVSGNRIYVGIKDGRVVATYQLTVIDGLSRTAARRAQIEAVRVSSHMRNQGLGHLLMQDAENRARAVGCVLLQLTSDRQRQEAQKFYESLGFVPSHIGFKKSL